VVLGLRDDYLPDLRSADELAGPGNRAISWRLNGRLMQNSNLSKMIFDTPTIVSCVSSMVPLLPGDVLSTGTPQGVGYTRHPPVFLQEGDICEVEIEKIGILRNAVLREISV